MQSPWEIMCAHVHLQNNVLRLSPVRFGCVSKRRPLSSRCLRPKTPASIPGCGSDNDIIFELLDFFFSYTLGVVAQAFNPSAR